MALGIGEQVAAMSEVEVDDAPSMHGANCGVEFVHEGLGQVAGEVVFSLCINTIRIHFGS